MTGRTLLVGVGLGSVAWVVLIGSAVLVYRGCAGSGPGAEVPVGASPSQVPGPPEGSQDGAVDRPAQIPVAGLPVGTRDDDGEPRGIQPNVGTNPPVATVRINGTEITAPAGSAIEYEVTETGPTLDRTAKGTGASLDASGKEIVAGHDASAPLSELGEKGGGKASGGATEVDAKVKGALGFNPLWLAPLGLIGLGAYFALRKPIPDLKSAMLCGVAGLALAAFIMFPSTLLVLLAVIALIGGKFLLDRKKATAEGTVISQAAGTEDIEDVNERRAQKARVDRHITPKERKLLTTLKVADGLPVGRDPH